MRQTTQTPPASHSPRARAFLAGAVAGLLGCGFGPQPQSGTVVCNPQGGVCCPDGYLCVGRGLATAGGPANGTCWRKSELPSEALAGTHDYTPATPYDSACLVTDWLPPELAGLARPPDASVPVGPAVPNTADAAPAVMDTGQGPAVPVPPAGFPTISAGGDRSYLVSNGKVLAWGYNADELLGTGATALSMTVPTEVVGLTAGVTAVSAGSSHTCVVVSGQVQCWGMNGVGRLGDGTTRTRTVPGPAVPLDASASAVAVGSGHSCALVDGGAVWCWGINSSGQLGNGSTEHSMVPTVVSGLATGVTAIAAGYDHTCAVVGGGLRCWGRNGDGQLGDGTTSVRTTPVPVVGLDSGVTAVTTGDFFSCALVGGGVQCWGYNRHGELANGTTASSPVPVQVSGLSTSVTGLAGGSSDAQHTCAILGSGSVRCWGYNIAFQLGATVASVAMAPAQVEGLTSGVKEISVGVSHTCARMVKGGVKCWGSNYRGGLGVPESTTGLTAVPVDVQFAIPH